MASDPAASTSPAAGPPRGALLVIFLTVFIDLLGFGIVLPVMPRQAEPYLAALDLPPMAGGIVIENLLRLAFGNEQRGYDLPLARDIVIGGIWRFGPQQIKNFGMAVAIMAAIWAFLRWTRTGRSMITGCATTTRGCGKRPMSMRP